MTPAVTVLLIRHGHTDAIGRRLVGRTPGVHLTSAGEAQARRLVDRLSATHLDAIYVSPLERARETAAPLAASRALTPRVLDDLTEVEFGEWTGLTFAELDTREDWRLFTVRRGTALVPGGEPAPAVQSRIVGALERLRRAHPGGMVAAVSHADVIRAAVMHDAGAPLDLIHRFAIMPASITTVLLAGGSATLVAVNERDRG